MIELDRVTVAYGAGAPPVLRDVSFRLDEGELCLVVGGTGSGKSTLLGAICGLVPHFTGGELAGHVRIDGRDTRDHPPRDLADVVGVVGQDPVAGFVTEIVEDELAYTMEQLAVPHDVMRKRVEETLDLLGIADLRRRPLRALSGGQQQRAAIGAALTAHPRVLVLDEPTSALDPTAAEEVLAAITRLVHDLGVTVVVAEHRLERVAAYADRVLWVPGDGRVVVGEPAEVLAETPIAPPVVELARLAGWSPPPLSIRDARRKAPALRERLEGREQIVDRPAPGEVSLRAEGVTVVHGSVVAVRDVDLELRSGQVVALMGRNGSGKSSLLWAVQGSGPRRSGTVVVDGTDPGRVGAAAARRLVGLVPQTPADLLYLPSVAEECAQADAESGAPAGTCRRLLDEIIDGIADDHHPSDLSEGQKLALVLAVQLTAAPDVILLDEPTRGLDYHAKDRFGALVRRLAAEGATVVISTHDVEFAATATDRVLVMAEGEVVADGPTHEVMLSSPAFAPQVAKVLRPAPWLTVDEVALALAAEAEGDRVGG